MSSEDEFERHSKSARLSLKRKKEFWKDIPNSDDSDVEVVHIPQENVVNEGPDDEPQINVQFDLSSVLIPTSDEDIENLFSSDSEGEFSGFETISPCDVPRDVPFFNNHKALVLNVTSDEQKCLIWLRELNLIAPDNLRCPECLKKKRKGILKYYKNEVQGEQRKANVRLQCTGAGKRCRQKYSPFKNTFFDGVTCHISVCKVLELVYCWIYRFSVKDTVREVEVTKNTVIDYFNYCRELCATSLSVDYKDTVIGGPGIIVEIDESKFFKRKYSRGRVLQSEQDGWVFGGIERGSGKLFMQRVPNRSKETLVPIILEHIREGSIIISDEWKAYSDLTSRGFTHSTVCHKRNFVSPQDPKVHTQNIEITWRYAKSIYPDNSTSKSLRGAGLACILP